jgi:hypothetical protein
VTGKDRFSFGMEYVPDTDQFTSSAWIRVTGGNLETPIAIRVGRDRGGRPMICGLVVGDGSPVEITSDALRKIRVGGMLKQLFEGFDPANPPTMYSDLGDRIEWGLMHEHVWKGAEPVESDTARGPDTEELRRFAEVYQQERVRNRNRAIAATANVLNISPATAHRRVAACRAKGLLPPKI